MDRLQPLWRGAARRWPWLLLAGLALVAAAGIVWAGSTPSGPRVLFLGWDETGTTQLFLTDMAGGPPAPLTAVSAQSGRAIGEYALSPDAEWIVYLTQPEPDAPGGESIWIMHRRRGNGRVLHTCPETHCRGLAWHADNRRLVFEQRPLDDNQLPGAPRLHWLDTVTGESAPLFQEEATTGMNARFSPDGNWIAYVTPDQDGVQLYNFENGRHFLARSLTGTPPVWHPEQPLLLISDLNRLETETVDEGEAEAEAGPDPHDALAVHLYRVDAVAGERALLSRPLLVEDGAPAWSPDGDQIAFGRRPPRTAAGRQLWLMDAAGGEERALTREPLVNYGPPVWSADGRFLLSQRFDLSDPAAEPAIWLIDVVGGDGRQLAANGVFPTWINNE